MTLLYRIGWLESPGLGIFAYSFSPSLAHARAFVEAFYQGPRDGIDEASALKALRQDALPQHAGWQKVVANEVDIDASSLFGTLPETDGGRVYTDRHNCLVLKQDATPELWLDIRMQRRRARRLVAFDKPRRAVPRQEAAEPAITAAHGTVGRVSLKKPVSFFRIPMIAPKNAELGAFVFAATVHKAQLFLEAFFADPDAGKSPAGLRAKLPGLQPALYIDGVVEVERVSLSAASTLYEDLRELRESGNTGYVAILKTDRHGDPRAWDAWLQAKNARLNGTQQIAYREIEDLEMVDNGARTLIPERATIVAEPAAPEEPMAKRPAFLSLVKSTGPQS